jgi:hypothetical protein
MAANVLSVSDCTLWNGLLSLSIRNTVGFGEYISSPTSANASKKCVINFKTLILKMETAFDVHGFVHHNVNYLEITNKMRPCIRILLFQRFFLLNMFRATHRLSSGAQKLYLQPLVYIRLWLPAADSVCKPEAANTAFEILIMSDVSLETC